ncbi:uncharacterized protein LOC127251749 [Andrographis paniculata]|uniref:uncharacterized protein LOC127251749 n=1 Tax=Andrographis paniculata TaxID=175694 RepID=UPI0021E8B693|nr:uncharacterized protein LOC127251749 [Andrographis paniculata]
MGSQNQETQQQQAPALIPHPPHHSPQLHQIGLMGSELGRNHSIPFQDNHQPSHLQLHPHPQLHPQTSPYAQSLEFQQAVRREMEMSRIRDDMIIAGIVRRRIESELRWDLTMPRELTLRPGITGLSFSSPDITGLSFSSQSMGFDAPARFPSMGLMAEAKLFDERNILPNFDREKESVSGESPPFQRITTNLNVSEAITVSEGAKEKEKIILQPNPEKISGLKRKAASSTDAADATENISKAILKKKAKAEWSCAICQVSATSERALNEHLEGKKHKAKEAKLKAKAAKNQFKKSKVEEITSPGTIDELKSNSEPLPSPKAEEASSKTNDQGVFQQNHSPDNLSESHLSSVQTVPKSSNPMKDKYEFWCAICQIGTHSKKVMDGHEAGKKHLAQLRKFNNNDAVGPSYPTKMIINQEAVAENEMVLDSDKVGELWSKSAKRAGKEDAFNAEATKIMVINETKDLPASDDTTKIAGTTN